MKRPRLQTALSLAVAALALIAAGAGLAPRGRDRDLAAWPVQNPSQDGCPSAGSA